MKFSYILLGVTITVIGISSIWLIQDNNQIQTLEQLEPQNEIEPEQIFQSNPRDEEYYIEKEQSESGLAREPDTEMTEEKLTSLQVSWGEDEMRRLHLSHSRTHNDEKYQEIVIKEFQSGKLSHITSCSQLNGYYLMYYGQVYGNQWDYSNNKLVTDYIKEKMWANGCEFKEQSELKEKIDAEKERVDEAVEKVMEELEEVNKEN